MYVEYCICRSGLNYVFMDLLCTQGTPYVKRSRLKIVAFISIDLFSDKPYK